MRLLQEFFILDVKYDGVMLMQLYSRDEYNIRKNHGYLYYPKQRENKVLGTELSVYYNKQVQGQEVNLLSYRAGVPKLFLVEAP